MNVRACFVEPCDARGGVLGIYLTDHTANPLNAARAAYRRFYAKGRDVSRAETWRVVGTGCEVVAEYSTSEVKA